MESILEKDFYPTPVEVIDQMMMTHDVCGKIVLEPSAGSGNIVDYLKINGAKEVIACEINEKLRAIISSKCRVIANDFLSLRSEDISHIDMIVMNPPFSNARKHILHAYEIAPEGCEIISLCNESDLSSRTWDKNEDRERLRELVDNFGHSEYYGQCFSTAERKTDVYVSCIHLYKPRTGENEFIDYTEFSMQEDIDLGNGQEGLIRYDFLHDIVGRYIDAVKKFDSVMAVSKDINDTISPFYKGCYGKEIVFGAHYSDGSSRKITRQRFKIELQKSAWKYIINKMNLERYSTSKLREQINDFTETQSHIPFTVKNIYKMIYMIVGTHDNRMNAALVEAFENICSFSSENSTAGEKWKTNSNYMINKRFIVPYMTEYDNRWNSLSTYLRVNYNSQYYKISDVITALQYITGTTPINDIYDYIRMNNLEWGKWHDCGSFFRFRGYKKGTMHFEFKDDKVWELFNRRVAEIKGWRLGSKH